MTMDLCCAGTFRLTLEFSEDYPNKAPIVKFKSTMFHPNSKPHCMPSTCPVMLSAITSLHLQQSALRGLVRC